MWCGRAGRAGHESYCQRLRRRQRWVRMCCLRGPKRRQQQPRSDRNMQTILLSILRFKLQRPEPIAGVQASVGAGAAPTERKTMNGVQTHGSISWTYGSIYYVVSRVLDLFEELNRR